MVKFVLLVCLLTDTSSVSDAVRIWNKAPNDVTGAKTLYEAKGAIKKFVKSLPN